ncbi:hypothetical protein RCL1_003339 [Eukaryota sp. TZLM3-RCL]
MVVTLDVCNARASRSTINKISPLDVVESKDKKNYSIPFNYLALVGHVRSDLFPSAVPHCGFLRKSELSFVIIISDCRCFITQTTIVFVILIFKSCNADEAITIYFTE